MSYSNLEDELRYALSLFDRSKYEQSKTIPFNAYLKEKHLTTADDIIKAFLHTFRQGYAGFHFVPSKYVVAVRPFLKSMFGPLEEKHFCVNCCENCKMVTIAIRPYSLGKNRDHSFYCYELNGTKYADFHYDLPDDWFL